MKFNDVYDLPITKTPKTDESIANQFVSNNIHDQGETGMCWDFAISTMLHGSLNLFISQLDANVSSQSRKKVAKDKLNHKDYHRQLRNEIITGPIPKDLLGLKQGHYVQFACERVMQFNKI